MEIIVGNGLKITIDGDKPLVVEGNGCQVNVNGAPQAPGPVIIGNNNQVEIGEGQHVYDYGGKPDRVVNIQGDFHFKR